jgi:hypothetical protein
MIEQWPRRSCVWASAKRQTIVALVADHFAVPLDFANRSAPIWGVGVVKCPFVAGDPMLQMLDEASNDSHSPSGFEPLPST